MPAGRRGTAGSSVRDRGRERGERRDPVRGRAGHRRDAARDACARASRRAEIPAASGVLDIDAAVPDSTIAVASERSRCGFGLGGRPGLRGGDRVGPGRRDRDGEPVGRARLASAARPVAVSTDASANCAVQRGVAHEHGTELDRLRRSRPASTVSMRPPMRSRASSTTTSKPASTSSRAAVSPARPAPITATRSPGSAMPATLAAARSPESRAPWSVPGAIEVASPRPRRTRDRRRVRRAPRAARARRPRRRS